MQVIIIGAGLFGSIAAHLARAAGYEVTVLDNRSPYAASKCSGNLFKPSWLESLSKEQCEGAYSVLHKLFTVEEIDVVVCPLLHKHVKLSWVDPRKVLAKPDRVVSVVGVGNGVVTLEGGEQLTGKVLVAAGVGCQGLVAMPPIKRLMGASLRVAGRITQPAVYLYAPYKHAVAFQAAPNVVWVGDGAAILEKNWQEPFRVNQLKERAKKFFKLSASNAEVRTGARPYVEGFKHGYFERVTPRTWVSTGGAKNGLVLAAYQAAQFVEAL